MPTPISIVESINVRIRDISRSMDQTIEQIRQAAPLVTSSSVDVAHVRDEIALNLLEVRKGLDTLTIAFGNLSDQGEALDDIVVKLAQAAGQLGEALSVAEPNVYDRRNLQTLVQNLGLFFERWPETITQTVMTMDEQILIDQAVENTDLGNKIDRIAAKVAEQKYRRVK